MPGRNIFTATIRPSGKRALCTWAIEAAATAVSLKSAKSSETDFWLVSSMIWIAFLPEKGGSLSCNCPSALASSGPIKSARVARACPNLIKPGPSACKASHKAWPASLRALLPAMRKFSIPSNRQNQRGSKSILARCPNTPARPRINPVRGKRHNRIRLSINPASSRNEWLQYRQTGCEYESGQIRLPQKTRPALRDAETYG